MEAAALTNYVHGGQLNFAEKKAAESSSGDDQDGCSQENGLKDTKVPKMDMSSSELNSKVSPSVQKRQCDLLESAKVEMGEVIEENQRLRTYLERIMREYRDLQMQFHDVVHQETTKPSSTITSLQENEEPEFVSLSLGRCSSTELKKPEDLGKKSNKEKVDDEEDKEGLALALDCKFEFPKTQQSETSPNPSPEKSLEEMKEEGGGTWPPQKGVKTTRPLDDEVSQQNPTKRARVSVRVRCDTPTMNDGCQWRKYGQKIAKGNPCPRAYYRCTVAPNCPVRKQVQRCADEMSILITTYEGTHNHPLPISATAMASTTSAAACMLMSGSTTSGTSATTSAPVSAPTPLVSSNLSGLNFYLGDNSKPKPSFYFPNSSISSSPSYPTITLDLTKNSSTTTLLNKMGNFSSRYSSTNLNFSSVDSTPVPMSWTNGMFNHGNGNQPYNKNHIGSLSFGRQPQQNVHQSYVQKGILNSSLHQSLPVETIAAATKAITSDPSFQSALADALTSIMGSARAPTNGRFGNQVATTEKSDQNLKLSETFPVLSTISSAPNGNKCASPLLNKSATNSLANSQSASLMFLPSLMPVSTSNNKSSSSGDKKDHVS